MEQHIWSPEQSLSLEHAWTQSPEVPSETLGQTLARVGDGRAAAIIMHVCGVLIKIIVIIMFVYYVINEFANINMCYTTEWG